MLLGDIFYYDKELDKFPAELTPAGLVEVNLLGLGELNPDDFSGLSDLEIRQALKDDFINQFTQTLAQNNLPKAKKIWQNLTSPFLISPSQINNYSEYQTKILDWIASGQNTQDLQDLVNDTKTLTEEEDLALGYALKVIFKLTNQDQSFTTSDLERLTPAKEALEVATSPQILILTEPQFFPLFVAQGCICHGLVKDHKILIQEVKKLLLLHTSLELIMLDTDNDGAVYYLQKELGTHIFVTSFNLSGITAAEGVTFFDRIVKATLGVRLT